MRRIPSFVWILTPLALGLLYWAAYPLFAPTPTGMNVVPAEAVLTHRFRDLAALNEAWWRPAGDPTRPSEVLAARRNLGGLPGVDPHRPFHRVVLPRGRSPDPTITIFPVANAEALRARFEDPAFFREKGFLRHAQYLAIRGDFAAIGGDREAIRHLGEGGLTAEDLGEDHVLAIRVPELVHLALLTPMQSPWREILGALGFDPSSTAVEILDGRAAGVPAGRVLRVYVSWREARLWSWGKEHRIRAEFKPAPGPLADALARLAKAEARPTSPVPDPPRRAQAFLWMPTAAARATMARALYDAGVAFPDGLGQDPDDPLGPWGRDRGEEDAGLLLWASPSTGIGYAWTLGLAAPEGALPPLAPFHPAFPADVGEAEVGAGELLLTRADLQHDRTAPAGRILRRRAQGLDVVVAGAAAEETWRRFETSLAQGERRPVPEPPGEGLHLIATFGLVEARARTLLGDELERGGLLHVLKGGDIEGAVWTDGRVLVIEARTDVPDPR